MELRGGADEVTRPVTAVNTLSTPAAAHLPKVAKPKVKAMGYNEIRRTQLIARAEKKRRKGKLVKIFSRRELKWLMDDGWFIVSHTPTGYLANNSWLLDKNV